MSLRQPVDDLLMEWLNSQVRREQDIAKAIKRLSDTVMRGNLELDQSFLTHEAEDVKLLTNYLKEVAGAGITFTDDTIARTRTIAATAGARPVYEDEFPGSELLDGGGAILYGDFHWFLHSGAVSATGAYGSAGSGGYPGTFTTTIGASQSVIFRPLFTSAPTWFSAAELFDWYIVASFEEFGGDCRVGFNGTSGVTLPPANGIYAEKLDADTNWFLVNRAAGSQTRKDTGVAFAGGFEQWELFRLRRVNATTIGLTIGTAAEVTETGTIPTTWLDPFFSLVTGVGGSGQMQMDLWRGFFTGLGAKRPTV